MHAGDVSQTIEDHEMELRLTDLKNLSVGEHPFRDGTITVRPRHVEMFREDQNIVFHVISETISGRVCYAIGTAKVS